MNKIFSVLMLFIVLFSSCSKEQKVENEAEKFFKGLKKTTLENQKILGLTEYKIFGRLNYENIEFLGSKNIINISEFPDTYNVKINFWIKGKTFTGIYIKEERKLHLKMQYKSQTKDWVIAEYYFDKKPLKLIKQLYTYLLLNLVVPIIGFLIFLSSGGDFTLAGKISWSIISIILTFAVAYACFGSGIALIICILINILFFIIIIIRSLISEY